MKIDKWKWFNEKEKKTWKNYPRVKIKCKGCGKEFTIYKSLGNTKYCSRECFKRFYIFTDEHKRKFSENIKKSLHKLHRYKKGNIPWNKGKHIPNNRIFFENNPKRKKIKETGYKLTKYLAYILGVLKGDGSLICYNNTYRLSLSVNDSNFAKKFKEYGEKQFGLIGYYKIVKDKWHKNMRHQVCFYSKDLGFLKDFDLNLILQNDEFKKEFINGFIDSEGCVTKKGGIVIYNTNKELLKFCQKILNSFGIKSYLGYSNHYFRKDGSNGICYRLFIGKDRYLFYQNFKFSIPRKQERLEFIIKGGGNNEKLDMANPISININSNS
jgi:hypothetical protein